MRLTKANWLVGTLLGTAILASPAAGDSQKSDPTSAEAWSAGNTAGAGNFVSYCVPCHGVEGNGDGVLSESLDAKPRKLSDPKFMSAKTDKHLFTVIKEGGASVGLTENMTPFAGQLSDEEIGNVVVYLRKEICRCEFKQK